MAQREKNEEKIARERENLKRESGVTSTRNYKSLQLVLVVGLIINYLEYSPHYTQKRNISRDDFFRSIM